MFLGKDFWRIIQIIKLIMRVLEEWSKENNEDTPKGEI